MRLTINQAGSALLGATLALLIPTTIQPNITPQQSLIKFNKQLEQLTSAIIRNMTPEKFLKYDTQHLLDYSEDKVTPTQDQKQIELLRDYIVAYGVRAGIPDMAARMDKLDIKIKILKPFFDTITPQKIAQTSVFDFAGEMIFRTAMGLRAWTFEESGFIPEGHKENQIISLLKKNLPQEITLFKNDFAVYSQPIFPFSFMTSIEHGYGSELKKQMTPSDYISLVQEMKKWDQNPQNFLDFSARMYAIFDGEEDFFRWYNIYLFRDYFNKKENKADPASSTQVQDVQTISDFLKEQKAITEKKGKTIDVTKKIAWIQKYTPIMPIIFNYLFKLTSHEVYRASTIKSSETIIVSENNDLKQYTDNYLHNLHTQPQQANQKNLYINALKNTTANNKEIYNDIASFRNLTFTGWKGLGDHTDYAFLYGLVFEYITRKSLDTHHFIIFIGNMYKQQILKGPIENSFTLIFKKNNEEIRVPFYEIAPEENIDAQLLKKYFADVQQKFKDLSIDFKDDISVSPEQYAGIAREFIFKPALELYTSSGATTEPKTTFHTPSSKN